MPAEKRGRPRKADWEKSKFTKYNEKCKIRKFAEDLGHADLVQPRYFRPQTQQDTTQTRICAPRSTPDIVKATLLAKLRSGDTWEAFAEAREDRGTYRTAVTQLQQALTADLDLTCTTRGAYLDARQIVPLWLHLAQRDGVLHEGIGRPRLNVFVDANVMYGRKHCQ